MFCGIIQDIFTKGVNKMNESLIKAIKSTMSSQLEKFTLLKKEYEMVKKTEPTNIQAQNEIAIKAQDVLND